MTTVNMMFFNLLLVTALLVVLVPAKLIDLSHDHGPDSFMSGGMPSFNRSTIMKGDYMPGVFVEGGQYFSGEHGGTHMDAPAHFLEGGQRLHEVPLENTIAEGVNIDCSEEVKKKKDYVVPLKKVQDWEKEHGKIPMGAAVIFSFNWSYRFDSVQEYIGTNYEDKDNYVFPSVSEEAGRWLFEERDLKIIATDTMTPDAFAINGKTTGFPIHQLLLANNRLIIENLKGPERLPPRGFRFHCAPVKFVGNTGAQVRAYAMTFDEDMENKASFIGSSQGQGLWVVVLMCIVRRVWGLLEG